MDLLKKIYLEIGPAGLCFIALVYIIIRGKISFEYPRSSHNDSKKK
jgi:hypothetical protein